MTEFETTQPPVEKEEKKERIDELDVIGGFMIKFIRDGFNKIKLLIAPRKVE